MAKAKGHRCIFHGCDREGVNQLGLRLRSYPGPDNVWTHDTGAYLCDEHSRYGLAIDLDVAVHGDPRQMWTCVSTELGEKVEREKTLRPERAATPPSPPES